MFSLKNCGDTSVSNVRRSLNFDEVIKTPSEAKPTRFQNGKRRLSIACRRLHFGETESSVLIRCPDALPNRDDPDKLSPCEESFRVKRTCFTFKQKTTLEELFQKKKFLNVNEKTRLAAELGVTKLEIQVWFEKRRQLLKKQQERGQVNNSKSSALQGNPQTPFPRPFHDAAIRVTTATAQASSDGTDLLPGDLIRGREDLNKSRGKTPDNSSQGRLFTPERVTYNTKRIAFLRQE